MTNEPETFQTDARRYGGVLSESFRKRYAEGRDSWTLEPAMAKPARLLLDSLDDGAPQRLLDVGTGRGRDLELFLQAGHRAVGLDLIEVPEWARLRAAWGDAVELERTSLLDYRSTMRFSAVLDNGCFHHQHPEHYPAYLERVHSLLMPGGKALFSVATPLEEGALGAVLTDGGRINRLFSAPEMREKLGQAGFEWLGAQRLARPNLKAHYLAILTRRLG